MNNVKEHPYKTVFGWQNDNGVGETLIQQILRGQKTATCAPKEEYSREELKQVYEPIGKVVTVYDKYGKPRCNIRLKDVYETTFGNPDMRLVQGEGNGRNIVKFQEDHRLAWKDISTELKDDTILIVELFELVNE